MRLKVSLVLLVSSLVPAVSSAGPILWGLDEYRIVTDYRQLNGSWRYGYEVSAARNGPAVSSVELDIDPAISLLDPVQSPTLPDGWGVAVAGDKIRFTTTTDPIAPNTTVRFEYSSPFAPAVASATLFDNPPVFTDNALTPGLGFFSGRPLKVWIGLGGFGAWTTRQARLDELIDERDHKKIVADYLGQYRLSAAFDQVGPGLDFPNSRAIVKFHHEGEGKPVAPGRWQYDYLARNDSTKADNMQGLPSPFDLYDRFAIAGIPLAQADGYIAWTRFVGPPNGFPGCKPCWDDPNWPDTVQFLGGRVDTEALGPSDVPGYVSMRADTFFGGRPIWGTFNVTVNPDFSAPEPFNLTPVPEPSSIWLVGGGLLVWLRARTRGRL